MKSFHVVHCLFNYRDKLNRKFIRWHKCHSSNNSFEFPSGIFSACPHVNKFTETENSSLLTPHPEMVWKCGKFNTHRIFNCNCKLTRTCAWLSGLFIEFLILFSPPLSARLKRFRRHEKNTTWQTDKRTVDKRLFTLCEWSSQAGWLRLGWSRGDGVGGKWEVFHKPFFLYLKYYSG